MGLVIIQTIRFTLSVVQAQEPLLIMEEALRVVVLATMVVVSFANIVGAQVQLGQMLEEYLVMLLLILLTELLGLQLLQLPFNVIARVQLVITLVEFLVSRRVEQEQQVQVEHAMRQIVIVKVPLEPKLEEYLDLTLETSAQQQTATHMD